MLFRSFTASLKSLTQLQELKQAVDEACQEKISLESIEPGHGARGKQCWLTCTDDLNDLYSVNNGKKEILLWCYTSDQAPMKRAHSSDVDGNDDAQKRTKSSRYDKFMDKMTEVEAIEADLREKHVDGPYTEYSFDHGRI